MAEFLVRNSDCTHAHGERPAFGKLDIVAEYEDGRCTEQPHPGSRFYLIKVPGLARQPSKAAHVFSNEKTVDEKMLAKSSWSLDYTLLSDEQRTILRREMWLTIAEADYNKILVDKVAQWPLLIVS